MQFLERLAVNQPGLRVGTLTFTRAATAEFATKMDDADLLGLGIVRPATVHSFALSTLLRIGSSTLPMPLRIPGKWETEQLIRPHLSRRLKADGYQHATPTVIKRVEEEMSAGWQALNPLEELYVNIDPALGAAYVGLSKQHRRRFGYVLLQNCRTRRDSHWKNTEPRASNSISSSSTNTRTSTWRTSR